MSERLLIIILVVFAGLACMLLTYPLRQGGFKRVIGCLVLFCLVGVSYYHWGGFVPLSAYIQESHNQQAAQQLLQSIKGPEDLIIKLKAKLDNTAKSAKGWYLLGRLYSGQNQKIKAVNAFKKAHELQPDEVQFTVNYGQSLWEANNRQFSPQITSIFEQLLKENPNQPDALAMLAMSAYMNHSFDEAIDYWQRLLQLTPRGSDEAFAIEKAIAKASKKGR